MAGNHRSNMFLQFPFLYKTKIFTFLEMFARDQVLAYYGSIEKMIAARVAESKHVRHDLYSLIVDEMNPQGEYLKDSEIWAEAAFFLPAGADTISACMCAALFYLSRYPGAYAKLAQEVRSSFASGDDIKGGPELAGCKYLRATIDETLRISPPAPGTLWRELSDAVEKRGPPMVVDGHVIPPGIQVGVNTYSILHNPEYFPNPFEFVPERWLEEAQGSDDAAAKATAHDAFVPFSTGARGCAGKAMAYAQCSLVLASILWYFDFEAAAGDPGKLGGGGPAMGSGRERENEYQLYDAASAAHDGPMLVFTPRVDA
ncbi:cytochrome p450 family protein [Apiospora arundinis]